MAETAITLDQIRDFKGKYPKQLWNLFFTEMWERFCFYGMRGMLTVFMVTQLGSAEKAANLQYGAIQAFVYAFTFIGGVFADKILGFQKSLFWGASLMILGGFIIAFSPVEMFYTGICFSIIGTGFFKPNISTMVGTLYHSDDSRRDAGFGLFYAGINFGALFGGALMVWVGKFHSWSLAFALVGIAMSISLVWFAFTRKSLGPIGGSPLRADMAPSRKRLLEIATYVGSLLSIPLILIMVTDTQYTDLFMYIVGPVALAYLLFEMRGFVGPDGEKGAGGALLATAGLVLLNGVLLVLSSLGHGLGDTAGYVVLAATFLCLILAMVQGNAPQRKLHAALIFILFSILFWAFFEQSGGSLSLFALNNLPADFLGLKIDPNMINNSSNSLFVIIFSAPLGLLWLWLNKRKQEPNSVVKFGLGFLLLGAAFYVFKSTMLFATAEGMTSLEIFTLAYLVITFGELCLSPIGLSLMTKLSPLKIQGLMMGMWFLASAYGQYVAGLLGAGMSSDDLQATNLDKLKLYTDGYGQLGLYALVAGLVLIAISPLVRKLMRGVH
ncbi:MAG: peptide MFS transporter [Flavobacteriales bacterium]|nr:peptide MFS transporter [Flavobacteriales bacterium]MCC6938640.1 peptide MFS transporter [Flavobacteriales bacterium]